MMMDFFQGHEPAIRVGAFGIVLAAMMMWEWRAPRRPLLAPRTARWIANLGMVALNTALIRLTFPIAAVGVAALAGEHGFG
ncbi:MAG: sterol desaturase family protein, partial [Rhodospirillales bacterium]|nr:sterol desaturase family protein [Rhodospirillales bacterium]